MPSHQPAFFLPSGIPPLTALAALPLALWFGGITAPEDAKATTSTCTMSASGISFGNVNVLAGSSVDVTATLTISCTGGGSNGQRLCISFGSGAIFTGTQRQLAGPGGALLNYDLYKDAARTTVWGSWETGFQGSGLQVDVPQVSTTNVTVYARLFGSQQTAPAGSYSSSFTADPHLRYEDKDNANANCPSLPGAKTASTSTSASANVVATCSVSATNLSFGSSNILAINLDANSQVSPLCNNGLPYTVALDGGLSGASDPSQRKMRKNTEEISYGLYRDAARLLPWGSTSGTNTASGTGTGNSQTLTVYGRVPPQTTGSPGLYNDTIIVNVIY